MTNNEFYTLLEQHDWFYQMTEDGSVYKRGEEAQRRLESIANGNEEKKNLFNAYSRYIWSRVNKDEAVNKPEIPKENT